MATQKSVPETTWPEQKSNFMIVRFYHLPILIIFLLITGVVQGQDLRPNIVIIISDDQGYQDLGCYGSPDIRTPNLDRLAAEGIRLTNFYAASSACTPSRSGLLTGRYPQRNGTFELFRNNMINYGHEYTEYEYSVSPERILGTDLREVFISEALKPAGYQNGYFGKWDLGQLRRFLPMQQGFDDFYGFANTGIDYFTHERYGVPSMIDGNEPTTKDKGIYTTELFEREALEFLEHTSRDQPFFLYLSYNAPHNPSNLDPEIRPFPQATEEFMKMYPGGKTRKEKQRQGYAAAVTQMDHSIGNILKEIKEMGVEENTLVIFLSDNGGSAGARNTPLRGGKARFFEGGIRVPCIIKWPDHVPEGQVSDAFLSALDIFPTVLEAAGVPLPSNITYDGTDILPVLQNKSSTARESMFWDFRGDQAARFHKWKWVESRHGSGLYDLSTDISETTDLSARYPDTLKMMQDLFEAWAKEMEEAEPRGPFKDF